MTIQYHISTIASVTESTEVTFIQTGNSHLPPICATFGWQVFSCRMKTLLK